MPKGQDSVVLPITIKTELDNYIIKQVKRGRYKSKSAYFNKAGYRLRKVGDAGCLSCDYCHKKFEKASDIDVSIEQTDKGIAVVKRHRGCKSPFEVSEGLKASA